MDLLLDAAAMAGSHAPDPDLAHVPAHGHVLVHPKGDRSKYILLFLALQI